MRYLEGRWRIPMPRLLRIAAALLIASVVVGCQGDTPAAPADDGSDLPDTDPEREALVALYDMLCTPIRRGSLGRVN